MPLSYAKITKTAKEVFPEKEWHGKSAGFNRRYMRRLIDARGREFNIRLKTTPLKEDSGESMVAKYDHCSSMFEQWKHTCTSGNITEVRFFFLCACFRP